MTNEPVVGRPKMPKGYGVPEDMENVLSWEHARRRLEEALVYWVVTVRPDRRPHISPVWGAWVDNRFYFEGSQETRRIKNISANLHVAMHLEGGLEGKDVIIVEGEAYPVETLDSDLAARLEDIYSRKYVSYNYHPNPKDWEGGGMYILQPHTVLGWTQFFGDATRWKFGK